MKAIAKVGLGLAALVGALAVFSKGPGARAKVGDTVDVPVDRVGGAGLPELLARLRQEQPDIQAWGIRVDSATDDALVGPIVEMVFGSGARIKMAALPQGVGPIQVKRDDVSAVHTA